MSVVVGFLATPEGRAALEAAVAEAVTRGERVVVVVSESPDSSEQSREQVEAALAEGDAELGRRGIDHEVRVLRGGDVADDLISTVDQTGASLVVLGLRRRSPVGKLILGSNAQRVLFDAACPVLTVKPAG